MRSTRHNWQISVKHPMTKRWRKHSVITRCSARYMEAYIKAIQRDWPEVRGIIIQP